MSLITVSQFANQAKVSIRTVQHAIQIGRIVATKYGSQWLIDRDQLQSSLWLSRRAGTQTEEIKNQLKYNREHKEVDA